VTLIWSFNFISLDPEFKVIFEKTFENGELIEEKKNDKKLILANYLALFPNRDILRIKLGSSQTSLYTIYLFDKRFKDKNFIGIFSLSEKNKKNYLCIIICSRLI